MRSPMTNNKFDEIIDSLYHCVKNKCPTCKRNKYGRCRAELNEDCIDAITQLREEKAELTGKNLELEMMVQDLGEQYKEEMLRRAIHDSIRDNAMRNALRVKVRKR